MTDFERHHIRANELRKGDVIATGTVLSAIRELNSGRIIVTRQKEGRPPFTSTFGRNTTVTVRRPV